MQMKLVDAYKYRCVCELKKYMSISKRICVHIKIFDDRSMSVLFFLGKPFIKLKSRNKVANYSDKGELQFRQG